MAKIYNDKYYTPRNVVLKVIELINKEIQEINLFDRIIEPSSGGGAFLKELPEKTIGYDIEPHYNNGNVITANYLEVDLDYIKNSLVIGNPPFDDGTGSNNLHSKFIIKSLEHSEYVVFVLPIDYYNRDNLNEAELFKSYKLPEVKYSGVKLKTCINFYKKRVKKLLKKEIRGVLIEKYSRTKNTSFLDEKKWIDKKCDYRFNAFGSLRILSKNESVKCSEFKLTFIDKKINFRPYLESFFKRCNKNSISTGGLSKQKLIDYIYDNFPEFRKE